jgi:galactonate dehydratase
MYAVTDKQKDKYMKITDVRLVYSKHYLFCHIYTDAGIVGLGEAGNWGYLKATAETILKFKDYLIGKDPFRIEDFNQNFYRSVYFRGSVIMSAISAIDIALWDIKGKALGVPVYELLGGKTREKVRVYASVMVKENNLQKLVDGYRKLQDDGFNAAKIFVNGPIRSENNGHDEFYSGRIEDELEKVRAIREAVGTHFDFVLEAHRGMTKPEAIAFGNEVAKYRPMVLEDPMTPDNIDSMAEIAQKIPVPIATGERFTNLREFEMLMRRDAAQYIRPDVCAV